VDVVNLLVNMLRQYLYIIILLFCLVGCSNVRMACTVDNNLKAIKDNKETTPTISDKAKDCVNNPTVIVFKEF